MAARSIRPASRASPLAALRAPTLVLGGTVAAAVLGWIGLVISARLLGPHGYASLAVLWAFFFSVAGVLFGLQQETTRSVSRAKDLAQASLGISLLPAALLLTGVLCVLLLSTGALWAEAVLGSNWLVMLLIAALGFVSLTVQSIILGSLSAWRRWTSFVQISLASAVIRLAVLLAVCILVPTQSGLLLAIGSGSAAWLLWAGTSEVRAALMVRGDTSAGRYLRGTVSTMIGTLCAGLMASGFPLLVALTSRTPPSTSGGVVFAAMMLTRAPLLMPVNALQLMMIGHFVQHRDRLARSVTRVTVLALIPCTLAFCAAGTIGPWVLEVVLGREFALSAGALAGLVAASTLLVTLTVTGTAWIALGHQGYSAAGWFVATVVALLILSSDGTLLVRCIVSGIVGPMCGLAVYLMLAALRHARLPRWA